jgi:mannose-6-phosphate isomerase-like protein (cupin superfamily)
MSNSENSNRDADNTPTFPYDYGPSSLVIDLNKAAQQNDNFRSTLWTGTYLQVTLMNIPVHGSIGMEVHTENDQILRIEEGLGLVQLGEDQFTMYGQYLAFTNYAILVPAGIWHNIINIGNDPLKISSFYAPPRYPWNTVQRTRIPASPFQNNA